ncbi:hypothetical protein [Lactococcus petauri]|uniref:hypothetical protein n=1 Tax=Lactococcus petauri TaxID=1940789 RepID=UPI00254F1BDD|nr:hypothetical protein [Lactococcus petauri]
MTDIIKFNETHTPKTEIGKMKFELAEALTAISDLQNPYRLTELSKEQRYKLYNKSMRKVCEILDIDLDMHEMMKTGAEGFSYSDTEDDTQALEKLLSDKQGHDIKIITRNEVQELNSKDVYGYILSDGEFIINEPNVVKETAQSADKRFCYGDFDEFVFDHDLENLEYIILKDENKVSGSTTLKVVGKLTDKQEQPQKSVKSILKTLQDMTHKAYALSEGDPDVFGDLVSEELDCIFELLGMTELSITAEVVKGQLPATTIKEQLQDIYSLNDSMITGNPNYIPRYTDGTVIKQSDLADMNMHALEVVSELLGFELEEGAVQLVQPQADKPVSEMTDQEIYDSLPAEDKLNVDMLNKLHEVQDHVLNSGQTAVGKNRITTAVTLLEAGLGVIDREEE